MQIPEFCRGIVTNRKNKASNKENTDLTRFDNCLHPQGRREEILFKSINSGYNQWGQYPSLYRQRSNEENKTKSSEFELERNSEFDLETAQNTCLSTVRRVCGCRQTAQYSTIMLSLSTAKGGLSTWAIAIDMAQWLSIVCIISLSVFAYPYISCRQHPWMSTAVLFSSLLLLLIPSVWVKKTLPTKFYPLSPQVKHF